MDRHEGAFRKAMLLRNDTYQDLKERVFRNMGLIKYSTFARDIGDII